MKGIMSRNNVDKYHITFRPRRAYANFSFSKGDFIKEFRNDAFIDLLYVVGEFCYETKDLKEIFRLIRDDYNRTYHFGRLRNARKKMTICQIKALTASFEVLKNPDMFLVRIPFVSVPILYFLLRKYLSVANRQNIIAQELLNVTIGELFCKNQTQIINADMGRLLEENRNDEEYVRHCQELTDDLVHSCDFVSMKWAQLYDCKIDYVNRHWRRFYES